jgi:hypothetical protein
VTVKELIEKLKEYPEDMKVFTYGEPCIGNKFDSTAYNPFPKKKRFIWKDRDYYIAQRACKETKDAKECLLL